MDASKFRLFKKLHQRRQIAFPYGVKVNEKSIIVGREIAQYLCESIEGIGKKSFFATISYSEEYKAVMLNPSSSNDGYKFSFNGMGGAPMSSSPYILKEKLIPQGLYIQSPTDKNIFVLGTPPETPIRSQEDIIKLYDFEEPQLDDIVNFAYRVGPRGGLILVAVGKVVEDESSSSEDHLLGIRPLSKAYLDMYPDKDIVYMSKSKLLVREKRNA